MVTGDGKAQLGLHDFLHICRGGSMVDSSGSAVPGHICLHQTSAAVTIVLENLTLLSCLGDVPGTRSCVVSWSSLAFPSSDPN